MAARRRTPVSGSPNGQVGTVDSDTTTVVAPYGEIATAAKVEDGQDIDIPEGTGSTGCSKKTRGATVHPVTKVISIMLPPALCYYDVDMANPHPVNAASAQQFGYNDFEHPMDCKMTV